MANYCRAVIKSPRGTEPYNDEQGFFSDDLVFALFFLSPKRGLKTLCFIPSALAAGNANEDIFYAKL
jgi:hypothetical protein